MKLWNRSVDRKVRYEFLPAAEEIVESPPSPFGRVVLWITVALVTIALLWSCFGRIDEIAIATGRVVPDGDVKVVQPLTQSTIKSIKVTEGQQVKKGQTLVEFDGALVEAAVASSEKSLSTAQLERDILRDINNGTDPAKTIADSNAPQGVKDDLAEMATSKLSASDIRRKLLSIDISQSQSGIDVEQQSQQTIEASLGQAQNSKQQLEQQIAQSPSSSLQTQLQTVSSQIDSLNNSLAAQKQRVSQAQSSLSTASTNLQSYNSDNSSTNFTNIVDQDKKIADLQDSLLKAKKALDQQALTAPVDGTVLSITSKTIGGVAAAGQPFMTIVPSDAKLYVEADVSTSDIGFVKVGQAVVVKVDTYSFQRYGYLDGKVDTISPDAVNDAKKGPIYKARISIDSMKTSKDNAIAVIPGMTVTNDVTTGQRSIIQFFLDPLMTHVDDSLKVR